MVGFGQAGKMVEGGRAVSSDSGQSLSAEPFAATAPSAASCEWGKGTTGCSHTETLPALEALKAFWVLLVFLIRILHLKQVCLDSGFIKTDNPMELLDNFTLVTIIITITIIIVTEAEKLQDPGRVNSTIASLAERSANFNLREELAEPEEE